MKLQNQTIPYIWDIWNRGIHTCLLTITLATVMLLQGCGGGGGGTPATYTIGGTVTGLTGTDLELQNNGSDDRPISGNGDFTFTTALNVSNGYDVTVLTHPAGQGCTVTNGSSTYPGANVTNVLVDCVDDADPTGYYENIGTATVGDNGEIGIDDLQGMVSGTRFMMLSITKGLLYDATITDVTGNDYTATVTIYTDGDIPVSATIAGNIVEGSSIEGTLTGTGVGNGSFSLTYDTAANSQVADIARIENTTNWTGPIGGSISDFGFDIRSGTVTTDSIVSRGVFISCDMNGTIAAIYGTNLYSVSVTLTTCTPNLDANTPYTGVATTRNADNTLVFVVTNGIYSVDGEFAR